MENTGLLSFGLGIIFAALVAGNWDAIVQTQMIRIFDAASWLSFCF